MPDNRTRELAWLGEEVHLIVCGLRSELVVTAVHRAGLSWYLEPAAEDLDQLGMFLTLGTPLIHGGRHTVLVIADTAGTPAEVTRWLRELAVLPPRELTLVLLHGPHPVAELRELPTPAGRVHTLHRHDDAQDWVHRLPALLGAGPSAHTLAVLAAAGGVGVSSVALGLATYAAAQQLPGPDGTLRVCATELTPTPAALPVFTRAFPATAEVPLHVTTTNPEALHTVLTDHDLVVLDLPGHTRTSTPAVLAASQMLLVTDSARSSAQATADLAEQLSGEGAPVGIVWNRLHESIRPPMEELRHLPHLTHLAHLPDTGSAHTHAVNLGELPRILWSCPDWSARIHLLTEAVLGPGRIRPITGEVERLLPLLHRDGRPRTALRLRRSPWTGRPQLRSTRGRGHRR